MPEEVLVSSSLTVGKTMPGTLKHFANGKEQRTPAPVTLLSASTLRIGDGDIRQIVASSTQDGIVNYLVTAGGPDAALRL